MVGEEARWTLKVGPSDNAAGLSELRSRGDAARGNPSGYGQESTPVGREGFWLGGPCAAFRCFRLGCRHGGPPYVPVKAEGSARHRPGANGEE
jgi:hypothetical protein